MKNLVLVSVMAFLAACGGAKEETTAPDTSSAEKASEEATQADASQEEDKPLYTRQDVPGSVIGREVAEVTLDEIKPAFTTETVTKLNAIVKRSLDVSNKYSRSVKSIRQSVTAAIAEDASAEQKVAAQEGIEKLRGWHETAVAAQTDMKTAADVLKASDESYSEELLAGMLRYVNDVEASLSNEITSLTDKLEAA